MTPTDPTVWASETLLAAQAMAHVGMWEWSAETGAVRWSEELCRLYGFNDERFEHDFDRFMATVVEEDRHLIADAMARAFRDREGFDFELRIVGEDGIARVLHAKGQVRVDPATDRVVGILGTSLDITGRKEAEAARAESELRFRTAFDDAPIGMVLVGTDGAMLRVNRSVAQMLGRSQEELLCLDFAQVTHPDDIEADLEQFQRLLDGEADGYTLEKRYLRPDGEVVWANLSVSVVRDEEGRPDYFVSQVQDVTEQRRLREHLHHLADHDPLTGLCNRRRFDHELAAGFSRAERYGEVAAIVLLDLNGFKRVNDTLGHHEGDEVLRRVAAALRARVRASDCAARIGGDEFAVLLLEVGLAEAEHVAGGLATAIAEAAGHGVTASVGVAMVDTTRPLEDALRAADRAMYARKAALLEA